MNHANKQLWKLSKGLKDKRHERLTEKFEKSVVKLKSVALVSEFQSKMKKNFKEAGKEVTEL